MAKFVFKLDPVLHARRHAERTAQRAVAELEQRRVEIEDALRRQQRFIVEGKQVLGARLVGRIDVNALRDHAGATVHLLRRANRLVLELAGVHQRLEAARNVLRERARERRAIELLRERRLATWKRDLDRAEARSLDELASHAAYRGKEPG